MDKPSKECLYTSPFGGYFYGLSPPCRNYVYQSEDLNVGSLINQITQGKMLDQRYCSKVHAIYQMVEKQTCQQL